MIWTILGKTLLRSRYSWNSEIQGCEEEVDGVELQVAVAESDDASRKATTDWELIQTEAA